MFSEKRGFGFITPDSGGMDIFVHKSAVTDAGMKTLTEGQRISFVVVTESGKSAAGNLGVA